MELWRRIGRQRWAKLTIGVVAAEYLRFVGKTTRFQLEPADIYARGEADMPIILAFWHGQHLLAPMARKTEHRVNMLVSRHRDGEVNAIAARRLGVGTIRGSGNHGGGFVHKAGVAAFQAMLDSLSEGASIAMSANCNPVHCVDATTRFIACLASRADSLPPLTSSSKLRFTRTIAAETALGSTSISRT